MYERDTIAAIATPLGHGGVAIIRLSGPEAESIARNTVALTRHSITLQSHHLYLGAITDPQTGRACDQGLLVIMRAPHSYTGEDVAEIHCHGGGFLARCVLSIVLRHGARLAQPGEFTKRAFLNEKLDLSQAEAVLDLIQAKSDQGLHLAWEQLTGYLSATYTALRDRLVRLTAYMEAFIDFPEEDIPERARHELVEEITLLINDVGALAGTYTQGKVYRDGVRTAIVGKPNVGKSSVLNLLVGTERAIVTAIPGTTRDVLEETVVVQGIPLVLWDTAGLRHTSDEVERIGVERARTGIQDAELVLAIFDASRPWEAEDEAVAEAVAGKQCLSLLNKIDLPLRLAVKEVASRFLHAPLKFSATTGQGKKELEDAIQAIVLGTDARQESPASAIVSHIRHHDALTKMVQSLKGARLALQEAVPLDLVAVDLRAALDHIGEITGHITSEDILDQIFRDFCVGK